MSDLYSLTLPELKKLCRSNGISGYSTLKKIDLINLLEKFNIGASQLEIELDMDQEYTFEHLDNELTLVSAGPGSGKTTTLCNICKYLFEKKTEKPLRICMVSYNVEAERRLREFLKNLDIRIIPKTQFGEKFEFNQVYCLTFHKLATQLFKDRSKDSSLGYRECIYRALDVNFSFDYLLIDEAHDINNELINFAEILCERSTHKIIVGDPRQEIIEGASWFTQLWSTTSEENKHTLRFNHRATPEIVNLLNNFSSKIFKSSHHNQISSKEPKENSVELIYTNDTFQALYEKIISQEQILIVCPVSAKKYNLEVIFNQVNEKLFREGYTNKKIKAIDVHDKYLPNDTSQIFAASSLKIKGMEKSTVIVLKGELDYAKYGNIEDRIAKRRLFVALSRAQDNLIVIHEDVKNNYFKELPLSENVKYYEPETRFTSKIYPATDCVSTIMEVCKIDENEFPKQKAMFLDMGPPSCEKGLIAEIVIALQLDLVPQAFREFSQNKILKNSGVVTGWYEGVLYLKNGESLDFPTITNQKNKQILEIYLFNEAAKYGIWKTSDISILEDILAKYRKNIKAFAKNFRLGLTKFQTPYLSKSTCFRSPSFSGVEISSIFDFQDQEGNIVEIKYAQPSTEHVYQLGLYCSQAKKNGILYNLFTGTIQKINPDLFLNPYFWSLEVPEQIVRINHFIRYAKSDSRYKRVPIENLDGKILITFDLETYRSFPSPGCTLLEAGGLAFYTSGKIESMVYKMGSSAIISNEGVGITYPNDFFAKESSAELYEHCLEWSSLFQGREISLKWAANISDYDLVRDKNNQIKEIDVMEIYKQWRELNGIHREHRDGYRSLSDCCMDLFNNTIQFRAHNAYEDSLMTAFCFLAMVDFYQVD